MIPQKVRVLLANGGHAKWLEREDHHFTTLSEMDADHDTASHPTGTVHQGQSLNRHGAGEMDLAESGRERFAQAIAHRLNRQSAEGEFQRLAIVAPPEVLRAIRDRLLPGVRNKVVHEIAKDLTKTPISELHRWLDTPLIG